MQCWDQFELRNSSKLELTGCLGEPDQVVVVGFQIGFVPEGDLPLIPEYAILLLLRSYTITALIRREYAQLYP